MHLNRSLFLIYIKLSDSLLNNFSLKITLFFDEIADKENFRHYWMKFFSAFKNKVKKNSILYDLKRVCCVSVCRMEFMKSNMENNIFFTSYQNEIFAYCQLEYLRSNEKFRAIFFKILIYCLKIIAGLFHSLLCHQMRQRAHPKVHMHSHSL